MRVTILGCGGAGGVPVIGVGWGACDPTELRNRRLRSSILLENERKEDEKEAVTTRILVDTGPDLRQQLLMTGVTHLDGILFTHSHADHCHGVDDLRGVNRAMGRAIPCWSDAQTLRALKERFGYCFVDVKQGQPIFRPWLIPHVIDGPFHIGSVPVTSWVQDHGWSETLGFRCGPVAYTTDVVRLSEEAFSLLVGVDVWIIGTVTDRPHPTHAHVDLALQWIDRIKPKKAVLTHMGFDLDYQTLCATLPPGVEPGYDGMIIDL